MLKFLNTLDDEGVKYVSWKNNHEINDSLKGFSDLDILIESNDRKLFLYLAKKHDWLELENAVAKFPSIIHLYKVSISGEVYHLHVYFEVVTGESWIKEFILPLSDFLIKRRIRSVKYDIWVLNDLAQAYIFFIRHLLKTGSFVSRFLYWREIESYKSEWGGCEIKAEDLNGIGPIKLDVYNFNSGLFENFAMPSLLQSIKFRLSLMRYCRFSIYILPLLRVKSFVIRALNKYAFKKKKKFLHKGLIIAISGADGAGKSTMINSLKQTLSSFQSCYVYTLGKPQGSIIEFVRRAIKSMIGQSSIERDSLHEDNVMSVKRGFSSIILALLRLRKANIAKKRADNGYLVLVDRWPTMNLGKMDSPKILINGNSTFLLKLMSRIEQYIYKKIPKVDLCFYLKVAVETAIIRNENREKIDKETKDEIIKRHYDNEKVTPLCKKIIYFNNDGSFNEMYCELKDIIWKQIVILRS